MTLNNHWGYHQSDHNWKTPIDVINMFLMSRASHGRLLLNIGSRGDVFIPERSSEIIRAIGKWLKEEGGLEAVTNCKKLSFNRKRPASSMVMVDRGEIFSKGEMATK